MNMSSRGQSSMSSFSSLQVNESPENDVIWELVKKPFSAWATAQQNIIVKQKPTPDLSAFPIGKGFQMSWYSKKEWLCGSIFKPRVFCWPYLYPGFSETWTKSGYKSGYSVFSLTARSTKMRSHTRMHSRRRKFSALVRLAI
jgi:hypothetical protein